MGEFQDVTPTPPPDGQTDGHHRTIEVDGRGRGGPSLHGRGDE